MKAMWMWEYVCTYSPSWNKTYILHVYYSRTIDKCIIYNNFLNKFLYFPLFSDKNLLFRSLGQCIFLCFLIETWQKWSESIYLYTLSVHWKQITNLGRIKIGHNFTILGSCKNTTAGIISCATLQFAFLVQCCPSHLILSYILYFSVFSIRNLAEMIRINLSVHTFSTL